MNKLPKLLIGIFLYSGSVFAQPGPTPPGGGQLGTGAPPSEVELSVEQRPNLSSEEMVGQARQYQQSMGLVLQRIQGLQETARRQKDIIKLNCVADKLVQTKVNVSIAEQAMTALQDNVARSDEGGRTHEFTRLTIINQKVTVLGAEAESCIGEDLSFVGATRVDVDIDPNIPRDDPTQPGTPTTAIDRPPPDKAPAVSPSA